MGWAEPPRGEDRSRFPGVKALGRDSVRGVGFEMSQWKRTESPKIRVPLEFREVTAAGAADRVWEVQELRGGAVFKVTLPADSSKHLRGGAARGLKEAEVERAICLSVEEALLSPPDKEPGITYEVAVSSDELAEAVASAS
jgi:hypothetical protein